MSNMMDYLKWRGDLTFSQSEFNEVDNLILSYFAYVNLDQVFKKGDKLTVEEVSKRFFQIHSEEEVKKDRSFIRLAPFVMKQMAESRRFKNAVIENYVNDIRTEESSQFSAMEIYLEDETVYVAYRGTDDTIVGWKEDFNLSSGVIPAQKKAAVYLDQTGRKTRWKLRVGGHSKGGNLCIYAASKCQENIQERILNVYCNDGPGFLESFYSDWGYQRVESKILRIVPEYSVIGMLLGHRVKPVFIRSSQKGMMQHDGMSWDVEGPEFIHLRKGDAAAAAFNRTLAQWLDEMEESDKELLISELFSVLEITGAQTLTELQEFRLKNAKAILKKVEELDPRTKQIVEELLVSLFGSWKAFLLSPNGRLKE